MCISKWINWIIFEVQWQINFLKCFSLRKYSSSSEKLEMFSFCRPIVPPYYIEDCPIYYEQRVLIFGVSAKIQHPLWMLPEPLMLCLMIRSPPIFRRDVNCRRKKIWAASSSHERLSKSHLIPQKYFWGAKWLLELKRTQVLVSQGIPRINAL